MAPQRKCLACHIRFWKQQFAFCVWDLLGAHAHGYILPSVVKNIYNQNQRKI